ncbi:MAG: hypothetical protein ACLQLC_06785 [Candidatus Sulfotelmatobacter sp.]
MSPINITFNATLPHKPPMISRENPTQEERAAAKSADVRYYDGDFFAVPSEDGVPFRLYISYVKRIRSEYSYDYAGDNDPPYDDPVLVAYNLFSLQANTVHFDMKSRKLEARGNVVAEDESGQHRAYSMTFRFENGQAIPVP